MFGLAADGKTNREGLAERAPARRDRQGAFRHGAAAISAGSPSAARTHARRTTWPRLRLPADLRARLRLDQEFHDARAYKRSHLGTSIIDRPRKAARGGHLPGSARRGPSPANPEARRTRLDSNTETSVGAAFGSRSRKRTAANVNHLRFSSARTRVLIRFSRLSHFLEARVSEGGVWARQQRARLGEISHRSQPGQVRPRSTPGHRRGPRAVSPISTKLSSRGPAISGIGVPLDPGAGADSCPVARSASASATVRGGNQLCTHLRHIAHPVLSAPSRRAPPRTRGTAQRAG